MTELFDVLGLDPSDNVVRAVAFALPIAVLLTLLALLRLRKKMKSRLTHKAATGQAQSPVAVVKTANGGTPNDAAVPSAPLPPAPVLTAEPRASLQAVKPEPPQPAAARLVVPAAAPQAPAHTVQPSAPAKPSPALDSAAVSPVPSGAATRPPEPEADPITTVKARLSEAYATAPKTALAPLYLELAVVCRASGDENACLSALRSAAGYGAQHGPRAAHAIARLELAEVALLQGDPTGACEQWQIARLLLHDDGQTEAYKRVDKRMRDSGCPTDWVLTDF